MAPKHTYTIRLNHRHKLFGADFKEQMLERMEDKLGEHHAGELHRETAEAKADRIVAAEPRRRHWTDADLMNRAKSDPA